MTRITKEYPFVKGKHTIKCIFRSLFIPYMGTYGQFFSNRIRAKPPISTQITKAGFLSKYSIWDVFRISNVEQGIMNVEGRYYKADIKT
jgi:hypothetical protein